MKKWLIATVIITVINIILVLIPAQTNNKTLELKVCYESASADTFLQMAYPEHQDLHSWHTYADHRLDSEGCATATINNLPNEVSYIFIDTTRGLKEKHQWLGQSKSPKSVFVNGQKRLIQPYAEDLGYKIWL